MIVSLPHDPYVGYKHKYTVAHLIITAVSSLTFTVTLQYNTIYSLLRYLNRSRIVWLLCMVNVYRLLEYVSSSSFGFEHENNSFHHKLLRRSKLIYFNYSLCKYEAAEIWIYGSKNSMATTCKFFRSESVDSGWYTTQKGCVYSILLCHNIVYILSCGWCLLPL